MLRKIVIGFIGAMCLINHIHTVPAQVIIIRHGEQPDDPNDNNLSAKGYERADALSAFFQMNTQVLEFGLPVAIFAVKPFTDTSRRSLEVVIPTSQSLGLPVHTPYIKNATAELAHLILNEPRYNGKMVLIGWEHNQMQQLTVDLGAPKPPHYPDNRFDLIYKITYTDPHNPTFCCGLQNLMQGDEDTVPAGFTACP